MSKLEVLDESRERGAHNPFVIDLISMVGDNQVELLILEARPWNDANVNTLEEKINNYLDYVLDGHLIAQYPQAKDRSIALKVKCKEEPHGNTEKLFQALEGYFAQIGWKLIIDIEK